MLNVARVAQEHKAVQWLFSVNLQEAVLIRRTGITKELLVMGFIDCDPLYALEHSIDLTIFDHETAVKLNQIALAHNKKFSVHIKVDTGLARLGFFPHEVVPLLKELQNYTGLWVKGIFTHLADTANVDSTNTSIQLDQFEVLLDSLKTATLLPPITHAISSGALALPTKYQYTVARIGGNCYGLWKAEIYQERFQTLYPHAKLYAALHWKATISHVKKVSAHTPIGYGYTYTTTRPSIIAVIPVGYVDGYPRVGSHVLSVVIAGYKAPVIGVVTMNMIVIDITDIPLLIIPGTEVTLLGGPYQNPLLSIDTIASHCGTIGNELAARISSTVSRILT